MIQLNTLMAQLREENATLENEIKFLNTEPQSKHNAEYLLNHVIPALQKIENPAEVSKYIKDHFQRWKERANFDNLTKALYPNDVPENVSLEDRDKFITAVSAAISKDLESMEENYKRIQEKAARMEQGGR